MRARLLSFVICVAGCGAADPCGRFPGRTCIAVEVRGPSTLEIDQLIFSASGAFPLVSVPTPNPARDTPVTPPLFVPILPGEVAGAFTLSVSARRLGADRGFGMTTGTLTVGRVLALPLDVAETNPGADLSGIDAARPPDLARAIDLAGADLADRGCDTLTQQPCVAGEKCIYLAGKSACRADGTVQVAQSCDGDPVDECVRGTQCLFPGNPGSGVCTQFCGANSDCKQPAVSVGGTALPKNVPYCTSNVDGTGTPSPKICSVACNPVATAGASGCPSGAVCVYASGGGIDEFTFCDRASTGTDGQMCDMLTFRCAPGFNCVAVVGGGTVCRAMCRAGVNTDCTGGHVCKPGAGGNPPMFGYCCPSAGC